MPDDRFQPALSEAKGPTTNDSVLPFPDARRVVEDHARSLPATDPEPLALLDCRGRVLAENLAADRDFPPFARATRDGFAVHSADLAAVPVRLEIAGEIRAGADPAALACDLKSGEAVAIMTGAPVPPGADAVVMIEFTDHAAPAGSASDFVTIQRTARSGENIVPAACEARAGDVVLSRGVRLDAAHLAVAASVGRTELLVHRRPRVAILSTGDEIVDIAAAPGPTQIRNSNTYSLAAQVAAAGGLPIPLPIAPDEPETLRHLIAQGLAADLLLLAGGVSMGKYDLVEQVLATFAAEFFFTGALIQPGKPVVFGRANRVGTSAAAPPRETRNEKRETYFLGLPGNPVSTMVCCELFARPLIDALSGAPPRPLRFLQARLAADISVKPGLTRFLPGLLSGELDRTEVRLAPWQGSGDVVSTARADCWLVIPPDRPRIPAGELVSVIPRSA